jgi:tRNA(fMet)-specific endonuclease VapC
MKYLLDTNTCIRYINGRSPGVLAKLPTIPIKDVVVCSIVRAELFYGSYKSQSPEISRQKQERFLLPYATLPFDDLAADTYGRIRAQLEQAGTPIGPLDTQIAAIALAHGLTLVTHNTREFSRVPGLLLEDWETP